jgi:hypothetical protein
MKLLATDDGLPEGFLELAPEIYDGDPYWIPEDAVITAVLFGDKGPWQGRKRAFCVPGRARAAAFRAPDFEVDGTPAAFFGYYESTGDAAAVKLVMDGVCEWAREAGAHTLYGPVNFTTAQPYRFRLAGPRNAYLDEPYNPQRYAEEVEALGFARVRSYASHDMNPDDVKAMADASEQHRAEIARKGYRFERLTPPVWAAHADELLPVGNAVFASNFAFRDMTREEFSTYFGDKWARKLNPELSLIVYGPEGDVAGVSFVYPHYAPLAAQGAGAGRVPASALNFEDHGRSNSEIVYKTAGVAPAHRRGGLGWAIVGETGHLAAAAGVTLLYMGPMREDNPSLNAVRGGWQEQRVYGLFAKQLT